jgi:hypothetical protein
MHEGADGDDKVIDQQYTSRHRYQEQNRTADEELQKDFPHWLRCLPKAERQDHFTGSVSLFLLMGLLPCKKSLPFLIF